MTWFGSCIVDWGVQHCNHPWMLQTTQGRPWLMEDSGARGNKVLTVESKALEGPWKGYVWKRRRRKSISSPPFPSSQVRCYKIGLHFAYYLLLFIYFTLYAFQVIWKEKNQVFSVFMYFESCSSATNERTPVVTNGSVHVFQKSLWNPFVEKRFLKNKMIWVKEEDAGADCARRRCRTVAGEMF